MKLSPSIFLKLAVVATSPVLLFSQRGVPQVRIRQAVSDSQRRVLPGNTHPLALAQFEQGAAPEDLPMERMMLVMTRSAEQQANLDRLLDNLSDPASSLFHHWLTPEQFGEQFGASDQDIQTISSWLVSYGFQVAPPSPGKTVLEFSGTAGQVAQAFHTSIHRYKVNGELHWANAKDPEIPDALAPVIAGIATLHNFAKQPQLVEYGKINGPSGLAEIPNFTSSTGGHALSPADYGTIYNINPAYQSGINGSGTTIAVVARSNFNLSDINNFRTQFGLVANPPQIVLNGTDPGDRGSGEETEVVLDTSWSGAVAPSATVKVVISRSTNTADGVDLSEAYIINNNLADVMTESFGSCENRYTAAQAQLSSSLAAQAAAQGITYLVSTGDAGASGCSSGSATTASGPLSVNVLASNPYVIAVGGTQFSEAAGTYWNPTNAAGTRSSALSYIPENAWNESCSVAQCGTSAAGLWSTGGGASMFFSKPSWQAGVPGIPADGARDVPDVSLTAAGHDPYLLCLRGSCAGSSVSFSGVGGTSASAPSFAGIMALIAQKTGARQGQANVTLYRLAASQSMGLCNGSVAGGVSSGCIFNDITIGNNAVPGGLNYGTSDAKYQTGVGYDQATGLGSVNVANLLNAWTNGSSPLGAPADTLSATDLDFGAVSVGISATRVLSLSNSGTAALAISSIAISSDRANAFAQTNNCPATLAPGAACSVTVSFTPRTAESFAATLTVSDSAPGSPRNVPLNGNAVGSLSLTLSPAAIDFGMQKLQYRSDTQTLQLANSTSQPVTISQMIITGTNAADFSLASMCPTSLPAGQSCSVYVVFTPQLLGIRSAFLTISSTIAGSPQTLPLTGSGVLMGAFEIANSVSGKVLDLPPGSSGNGTLIQQSSVNGQGQQQWVFYPVDNGFYYILNASTGKALDNPDGSLADGALLQQWDYLGGANQQWQLIALDDVHYKIVNRASGKVLDVPGGSTQSGTLLQQWDANGLSQQAWALLPAGSYRLLNSGSGLVLDAPDGLTANGTLVQQFSWNAGTQQQWQLMPTGGGYYAILNRQSGKVLDVTGGSSTNGTLVQEFDYLGGGNQQWSFVLLDAIHCAIVNRSSGRALDVLNRSLANGALIQQWDYLAGANQIWQISPVGGL